MLISEMKIDRRYVVTHPGADGSFEVGDHVRVGSDGTIICVEAGGFLMSTEITDDVEVVVDEDWIYRKVKHHQEEIKRLNNILTDG